MLIVLQKRKKNPTTGSDKSFLLKSLLKHNIAILALLNSMETRGK